MENRAPKFEVGQLVRVLRAYTGRSTEHKVLHVGKRHVIVEWKDFSSGQARFNLKPTYGAWQNDYLGATLHQPKSAFGKYAAEVNEEIHRIEDENPSLTKTERENVVRSGYEMGVGPRDCAAQVLSDREDAEEARFNAHIAREGSGAANEHPDGCYNCGNKAHHTVDCPWQRGYPNEEAEQLAYDPINGTH